MPIAKFYIQSPGSRGTFGSLIKMKSKMATLLKYQDGLLVPVKENNVVENISQAVNSNRFGKTRKLMNILIVLGVIINTILTIAVAI